ncbi:MAG: hypothetical protein Fur0021_36090 [Candidatus Promineifilaceae bacterium]
MLRLIHQSDTRLELRCYSVWGRIAAWGLILGGVMALALWGQVLSLHCRRLGPATVSCNYRASWLGLPGRAENIEVRGAELAGSRSIYGVNLITAGDELPVTRVSALGYRRQRDLVVQINKFVADWEQSTLAISSFYPWWRYLLLAAPLLGGLLLLSLLPTITLTLQKQGVLTIHRRTWWRRRVHTYPLSQVETILLQPRPLRPPLLHLRPAAPAPYSLPRLSRRDRARLIALVNQF